MEKITILDTTLRDGAQGEGVSFSVEDKISIVSALISLGIEYIEAGNPGSNQKDQELFKRINAPGLVAFGSTRRHGVSVTSDPGIVALDEVNCGTVAIFGKTWDLHVREVIGCSLDENLAMIYDTISHFKDMGREVIFDAEHYFDGAVSDSGYALQVLATAREAGADILCLCDTNGGSIPRLVYDMTCRAMEKGCQIGIHCHNDIGLAVANTLAAVEAGARHVQGTLNGIGERCGNTALSTVIPNLQLKYGFSCLTEGQLSMLTPTARHVAEISNMSVGNNQPYVGVSAFAHKAGMHIDGVMKLSKSFEHIDPETVGNSRRILTSEIAGRTLLASRMKSVLPSITRDCAEVRQMMDRLKQMEYDGYQYESAEASFELLVRREFGLHKPSFELVSYKIIGELPPADNCTASAIVKIRVGKRDALTAGEGVGPVHALDNALRRALESFFPVISSMRLVDYKVRVMDSKAATGAQVRVLITTSDGENVWTTIGVSADIIEASWIALVDSIEYGLIKSNGS